MERREEFVSFSPSPYLSLSIAPRFPLNLSAVHRKIGYGGFPVRFRRVRVGQAAENLTVLPIFPDFLNVPIRVHR